MGGVKTTGPGSNSSKGHSAVAAHIGMRIKLRRRLLGIERDDLGRMIRMPELELEQFEEGLQPLDVATLYRIAAALEVPLAWFYDGIDVSTHLPFEDEDRSNESAVHEATEVMTENVRLALLTVYFRQLDAADQSRLLGMARAWASLPPE
jgi:transcriptional regulator with XRE-family HTH domain